jgi:thiamine pyrophosphokinase
VAVVEVAWVVIGDHGGDLDVDGLARPDHVVCADAGLAVAHRLGLAVDVLVGDLDSVADADLRRAEREGVEVRRHPADKDRTDLELALALAAATARRVVLVGGSGGRLDHALANVVALASDALAGTDVHARLGSADVHVVRDGLELDLASGELVTLLPSGGAVDGVTTRGLRWQLDDETLPPWTARGISNVVDAPPVRVEVGDGCLLVVVPRRD